MSFDTLAPWYRTLELITFGSTLQRCRVACLDKITPPRRAIIVGEGNGRFLSELLRRYPEVEVDCVDASQRMLKLARQRIDRLCDSRTANVRFLHRDIMAWDPPRDRYDLIVTHFFLDCFPEPIVIEIVRKLTGVATPGANWLLSDFRIPPGGFARVRARIWLAVMYRFFRTATGIEAAQLIDPTPILCAEGLTLKHQHLFRSGMLKSEVWRVRNG